MPVPIANIHDDLFTFFLCVRDMVGKTTGCVTRTDTGLVFNLISENAAAAIRVDTLREHYRQDPELFAQNVSDVLRGHIPESIRRAFYQNIFDELCSDDAPNVASYEPSYEPLDVWTRLMV